MQDKSRQVGLELQGWRPFAPMPWQAPTLVPRLAHTLMPDPRWEEAARPLRDWLVGLAKR